MEEACAVARRIGYPVLVRPSYVLGGRAMVIAYDEDTVRRYMREAVTFSQDRPVLIDRFLEDATEVDVDALADHRRRPDRRHHGAHRRSRRALRRQLLRAARRSPSSRASSRPSRTTPRAWRARCNVIGLMNVQYAIKDGTVYVLEVNPRASRTVPYVSKATGVPLPKIAVGLMLGQEARGFHGSDRRPLLGRAAGAAGSS